MNYRHALAFSIVPFTVLACAPAQDRDAALEEDRRALEELHELHVQAARAEDTEAFLATVTDDFALLPPNDPGARGKAAVGVWFENTFGAFSIAELDFLTTEFHIDHDWALMHYTYDWTLTPDAGGDPIRDLGDGMYAYRREADGSWKIAYDLWTSSEPLPSSQ